MAEPVVPRAPMELMVAWDVRSLWLAPTPNSCVPPLLGIPAGTQQIPGSFGPLLRAAAGFLCLLLRVGSCPGSLKVPPVRFGLQQRAV